MLPNSSAARRKHYKHKHLSVNYFVEGSTIFEFTHLFWRDGEAEETLRTILVWSALGVNKAKVSFLGKLGINVREAPRAPVKQ